MTVVVKGDGPVLAVDDDVIFRDVFELLYKASGLENELIIFEDGLSCVEYFDKVSKSSDPMPALVVMDINMPGIDGIETVRRLRQRDQFSVIPIIMMLSSSDEKNDIVESQNAGANGYMVKPHCAEDLKFVKG